MKHDYLPCVSTHGIYRMHYTDWGDPLNSRIVICVHGLTRNCRDFDFLAERLAADFRVVCPDIVGRGQSDWLPAAEDYALPRYVCDMRSLITRILFWSSWRERLMRLRDFVTLRYSPRSLCWIGTSMGGVIGMWLAAQPGSPIRKLVINDIGPLIPRSFLEQIGRNIAKDIMFGTFTELESYVREISASFGDLTDAQWRHLTLHNAIQIADGRWRMIYDPRIGRPFRVATLQDIDLWSIWDAISCPTLVLRGAQSDLLPLGMANEMRQRGPRPRVIEFPGIGHAPMLMSKFQISAVREFLLAPE